MNIGALLVWWKDAVRDVLVNPHSFFHSLENEEDFHSPTVFLILSTLVGLVINFGAGLLGIAGSGIPGLPTQSLQFLGIGAAFLVIIAGLYLLLLFAYSVGTTLMIAGFFNIFYYYLGGIGRLSSTYKVLAYLSAFQVPYAVLTVLGGLAGGIIGQVLLGVMILLALYALYVGLVGFSIRHDISMVRAAAPYLALLLLVLVFAGLYMLVMSQMQSTLGGLGATTGTTSPTLPS